jgi:hypothetical protein
MTQDKKFTWYDLKRVIDKMPLSRLRDEVRVWADEQGGYVSGVEILKEDYHDDGDVGTMPKSVMLENLGDDDPEDYPLIFPKGTRILSVEI